MTDNDTQSDEKATDDPAADAQATDETGADETTAFDSDGDVTDDTGTEGVTTETEEATTQTDESQDGGIVTYIQWAAFVILALVALVATFRFYFAISNAINNFVTRQYRPIFQAVFNLVILLASGLGLSVLVRRIT